MNMTRRCFFTGAVAAAVLPRAAQAMMAAGGKDPREWDEILSENRACAHMTFPF